MGKRAPVCLLGLLLFFATQPPKAAQEANPSSPAGNGGVESPTGFNPGKYFTQDDYEHLEAALAYIDLTPADLSYEKKHRPDKFILPVAAQALDQPLAVPGMAEEAASQFAMGGSARQRLAHTESLLALQSRRINDGQLAADLVHYEALKEQTAEIEKKDGADAAVKARHLIRSTAVMGGHPKEAHDLDKIQRLSDGSSRKLDDESIKSIRNEIVGTIERIYHATSALRRQGHDLSSREMGVMARMSIELMSAEAPVPGAESTEGSWLEAGIKVPVPGHLAAGYWLSEAMDMFKSAWLAALADKSRGDLGGVTSDVPGVTGGIIGAWQGPWGRIVIGGTGPNTYEGDDFIGIIDLGGDDIYRGRVASGIGLPGRSPISFVLDLGGNDRYEGGDFTQGFGFLGVGILHDLGGGNDYYSARFCAQGCGLCGYGELYDDGGDDIYVADSGAQGAAAFGYGHLIDASGNDTYRGARYVQAFAQVMGVGVLTDGAGNDLYFAGAKYLHQPLWNDRYQSLSQGFAIGNRYSETGGGVALLLDQGDGNDVYQCDIYGQGSSYWYSLGMLVDEGGNDTYTAGQYCQGAGIHLSAGILVDLSGNDTYSMGVGLGQGAAHDWAVGWLIDRAGNDHYQGNGQGMGLNYSFGILLDCGGNDCHSTNPDGGIGKGHNNDISVLLNLAGTNRYTADGVKGGQFTRRGKRAIVYDPPEGWFPKIDPKTWPTHQDPAPDKVKVQHILISWKGANERVTPKDPDRTKEQATSLRDAVLKEARTKGGDWKALQLAHNEDSAPHNTYEATPTARLVKPFLDLSLSLGVGQIGWCESQFGYHIIKRIE
ncbi:MAG: peptidylprolyl isomerase [Planctomycetes bacterium]|nr:peptidylprolyl isomerase [Planctomycetota bacterium]MCW8135538.1 peptidylprolyl isomerase [Planctomycetota bacterium]